MRTQKVRISKERILFYLLLKKGGVCESYIYQV